MDTRTGEIFPFYEIEELRALRAAGKELDDEQRGKLERFELAEGYVVPVSADVARQQLLGQRVDALVRELQLRDPDAS